MGQQIETTEFVTLLTSYQRRIYGYIATLLPNPADCEEVLQQTNLILWSKADEFRPGTSFRAWAFRIAQLEVVAHCRKNAREHRLFGSELVETMARELLDRDEDRTKIALTALRACLDKLDASDRELILHRYSTTDNVRQIAADLGRPVSSVYRSLDRIRFALLACIQQALAEEDRP